MIMSNCLNSTRILWVAFNLELQRTFVTTGRKQYISFEENLWELAEINFVSILPKEIAEK